MMNFGGLIAALDGNVAAYYGNRSQCHLKLNAFSEALADSVKSTEIDAKFGKGWIRAGVCHVRLGNFDEATSCFNTARKIRVPPMGVVFYRFSTVFRLFFDGFATDLGLF